MSRDPFGIRIPRLPDLKPESAREATPPVGELTERVKLSAETLLKCAEPERVMAEAWQGVIRGLLAELSAAPAPAPPAGETVRERIAEQLEEIANNFQIDPRQPLRELAAALRGERE